MYDQTANVPIATPNTLKPPSRASDLPTELGTPVVVAVPPTRTLVTVSVSFGVAVTVATVPPCGVVPGAGVVFASLFNGTVRAC